MKITQIPMGAHNAQLTCYLQDPCTEMPALDRCPAILIFPGGAYAFCSDREADPVALAFLNAGYNAFVLRYLSLIHIFAPRKTAKGNAPHPEARSPFLLHCKTA